MVASRVCLRCRNSALVHAVMSSLPCPGRRVPIAWVGRHTTHSLAMQSIPPRRTENIRQSESVSRRHGTGVSEARPVCLREAHRICSRSNLTCPDVEFGQQGPRGVNNICLLYPFLRFRHRHCFSNGLGQSASPSPVPWEWIPAQLICTPLMLLRRRRQPGRRGLASSPPPLLALDGRCLGDAAPGAHAP